MSAVHKLASQEPIQIGGLPASPATRPAIRTAPRRKRSPLTVAFFGGLWMLLMWLCFSLIQTNMAVRAAGADAARMHEEIARYEARNRELESKVAVATSVATIEAWAKANNMVPPSNTVGLLQGKPEAVAVRNLPQAPAESVAVAEKPSIWQALLGKIGLNQGASGSR